MPAVQLPLSKGTSTGVAPPAGTYAATLEIREFETISLSYWMASDEEAPGPVPETAYWPWRLVYADTLTVSVTLG